MLLHYLQALMAASNATEEQRLALREDLRHQIADMRALEAAAAVGKAEQQQLLERLAALQSKERQCALSTVSDTQSVHACCMTAGCTCAMLCHAMPCHALTHCQAGAAWR